MSQSLNALKRGYIGDCIGTIIGVTNGDTMSLDNALTYISTPAIPILNPFSKSP